MVEKMPVSETTTKYVVSSITCDICQRRFSFEDDVFEVQEFTHIRKTGGYGSVFGDGDSIELDMCQHCLKEKLGGYIRIIEED